MTGEPEVTGSKGKSFSVKKFFSAGFGAMTQKSVLLAKRFPVSILLIAGVATMLFMGLGIGEDWEYLTTRLYIFFSLGAVISVAATLWLEDFIGELKRYIITVAVTLLWGGYCLFFNIEDSGINEIIELCVIGIAAYLAVFFVSFLKKDKDKAFWRFSTQVVFQYCVATCFGMIIFIGLSLAVLIVDVLFGTEINESRFQDIAIFCFALFSPLYFLANIPNRIDKHNDEIALNKVCKILALYILTPIAAIYAVILYVYLFKIITAWELPNGYVSYMVSALMGIGLIVIALLYPARFTLPRWFGVVMLPLLALMSVGISRRLGDYGITVYRGYLLLLNLWFYGICVYIFITKARRVKWILVSFAAIALLASIGPWSIANVTKSILIAEVKKHLDLENMKPEDRKKINDKVEYLRETFGEASVQSMDTSAVSRLKTETETEKENKKEEYRRMMGMYFYTGTDNRWYNETLSVENFNAFIPLYYKHHVNNRYNNIEYALKNNLLTIKIASEKRVFSVPLQEKILPELRAVKDKRRDHRFNKPVVFQNDDYIIWVNDIDGHYYEMADTVSVSEFTGYLFYNK